MTVLTDRLTVGIGPLGEGATTDAARRRVVEPLGRPGSATQKAGAGWLELELARGVQG